MTATAKALPSLKVPSEFHLGALSTTMWLLLAPVLWHLAALAYIKVSGGSGAGAGAGAGAGMVLAMVGPLSWFVALISTAPLVASRPRNEPTPEGTETLAFFRSQVNTLALRVRKTWRVVAALTLVTLLAGGCIFLMGTPPKEGLLLVLLAMFSLWSLFLVPIFVVSTAIVAFVYQLVLLRAKSQLSALEASTTQAAPAEAPPAEPAEQ